MAINSLTRDQMIGVLRQAGWEDEYIPWALEVSRRESGWQPGVVNDTASTGDLSYGLFQINMIGGMGPERLKRWGLSSNEQLKDPVVNARVARDLLNNQGPRAWSVTHGGDIPFPGRMEYTPPKSYLKGQASMGLPGAAHASTGDVASGDLGGVLATTFPGSDVSGNIQDRIKAARVDALSSALAGTSGETASTKPGIERRLTAPTTKGYEIIEYLTGDRGHSGYRDDHAGSNYHEHFAFKTPEGARRAAALLNKAGVITTELKGVNTVGQHSPNSYHYVGQAFDVPGHQWDVGKESAGSRYVRKVLGFA